MSWTITKDSFRWTRPAQGRSWANYLSNREYGVRLNQFAAGYSSTLSEPRLLVTHHAWHQETKGRFVYLVDRDSGDLWNPTFLPARSVLDDHRIEHGLGWSAFLGSRGGIQAESRHFVPREGCFEVWRVRVTNTGATLRRLTVAAQAEFLLQQPLMPDVPYYSWYQDVRPLADGVEAVSVTPGSRRALGFFRALTAPAGFEGSLRTFYGEGDAARPASLFAPALNSPGAGDPPAACLRWDVELAPGATWETALFLGEGEAARDRSRRFATLAAVDAEETAVRRDWLRRLVPRTLFQLEDGPLDDWLKGFFAYQIHQQAGGLVRTGSRGFRDAAQDAVGLGYYDLDAARALLLDLVRHQHRDGRCLRQWSLTGGADDERDFRDLPFWMVWAVHRHLEQGGDPSLLDEKLPYLEAGAETVLEHLRRGLQYALKFGPHDLLLIGVGDWNDALSALGQGGESLWLNQFAYLCLEQYGQLVERADRAPGLDVEALRERLYAGVAAGWTGKWFLRGYHESGAVLGGPERVFLLPQAWFTLSGMARRDPARGKAALDAMLRRLEHADGLLKCDPAFDAFDPLVGNLSALTPGMAENFAVYNHASAFGAYALHQAGRETDALRIMGKLLPFRKDAERTLVEPYVLVNYYNGGHYDDHAGRGGISWLTGTANWLAMLVFDRIIPSKVDGHSDEA